jgi:hypothetical protein
MLTLTELCCRRRTRAGDDQTGVEEGWRVPPLALPQLAMAALSHPHDPAHPQPPHQRPHEPHHHHEHHGCRRTRRAYARHTARRMAAAGGASTWAAPCESFKLPAVCTAGYASSASSPTMRRTPQQPGEAQAPQATGGIEELELVMCMCKTQYSS